MSRYGTQNNRISDIYLYLTLNTLLFDVKYGRFYYAMLWNQVVGYRLPYTLCYEKIA